MLKKFLATLALLLTVNAFAQPVVTLTAPVASGRFASPAELTLTATAQDATDAIRQVDFYNGAALLGSATAEPYSFTWTNVASGKYALKATAINSKGLRKVSRIVTVTVNNAPTITLTAPATGASQSGPATVRLAADAADNDGEISKVQFYRGGTLLGTVARAPYVLDWPGALPGAYSITARATDNLGAVTTSPRATVSITNPVTVGITTPASNARFLPGATIDLRAEAGVGNGSATETGTGAVTETGTGTVTGNIARVDFYEGANLIGTAVSAPFTVAWSNVPTGKYRLTAKATDSQGISQTSRAIAIIVNAPPLATLTSPSDNAAYPENTTVPLAAQVSDSDGSISKVQFLRGGTVLATLTGPPYAYQWTNIPKGNHSLRVRATDNLGATTTSSAVTVAVTGQPSSVFFIETDHLNTPRVITDERGNVVWQWESEPFGSTPPEEFADSSGEPFVFNLRFPGQYFDKETGLHYNYFRDYDPKTGRYFQSDPIGLAGGLNTFEYVGGNPLSKTDPEGLQAVIPTPMGPVPMPVVPAGGGVILPPPGGYPPGIDYPFTPEASMAHVGVLPKRPPTPPKPDCDTIFNICKGSVKSTCSTFVSKAAGYASCLGSFAICKKVFGGDGH